MKCFKTVLHIERAVPSVSCRYLLVWNPFTPAKVISFHCARACVRMCGCVCVRVAVVMQWWTENVFECFVKLIVVRLLAPFCALLFLQGNLYCKGIVVLLGSNCSLCPVTNVFPKSRLCTCQ